MKSVYPLLLARTKILKGPFFPKNSERQRTVLGTEKGREKKGMGKTPLSSITAVKIEIAGNSTVPNTISGNSTIY